MTMDKTDLLLQMTEHPEDYTEEQLRQTLSDSECRELYQLMSDVQSVLVADDVDVDREWQHFVCRHAHSRRWPRVAASLAGLAVVSGLAVGGVVSLTHRLTADTVAQKVADSATVQPVQAAALPQTTPVCMEPVVFDNVRLDSMVRQMAIYYNVRARIANDSLGAVRLFFQWNPSEPLEHVVERLSHFERVSLQLSDSTLTVE